MKISALSLALAAVLATIPFLSVSAIGPAPSGCISTFASPSALDQLTFAAEEGDNENIQRPPLTRANVDLSSIQPHATETVNLNLPPGVRLTGGDKLRAAGLTGKGVRVAVIDTGVDAEHPGFNGQVTRKKWYRSGTLLKESKEKNYRHGTHVAGTIHMMAPDAEIYDYRVFGEPGETGETEDEAIESAIRQAIEDGCQIINMSLGGPRKNYDIAKAIDFAHEKGVLMIVSAGNKGDDNPRTHEYSYPAMNSKTVSVAAVYKTKGCRTAKFSNNNHAVDYAGIGMNVISFNAKSEGGEDYAYMNGTSMASPHVCGFVAALMTKDRPYSDIINYSDIIKDDESLRTLLNDRFVREISEKDLKVATGKGFLTYLNKQEYEDMCSELDLENIL